MTFVMQGIDDIDNSWNSVPGEVYSKLSLNDTIMAARWCVNHASKGKFYFQGRIWYFEHVNDALIFALRWGSK